MDNKLIEAQTLSNKDGLIRMALDELCVPNENYPASVANAVGLLKASLDIKLNPVYHY